ncbi:hypothetical protein RCOM_0654740 [Ricinus communis]|uniref:Uncharacterized protein n=1 Tax=Ricinus communis TaxID=3988 RepID=B9S5U6_RICCO|nr:hypothetical protein RCOM_0654740 [Ricinus communis]
MLSGGCRASLGMTYSRILELCSGKCKDRRVVEHYFRGIWCSSNLNDEQLDKAKRISSHLCEESEAGQSHSNALIREEMYMALAIFENHKRHNGALQRFQTLLTDRNTPLLSVGLRKKFCSNEKADAVEGFSAIRQDPSIAMNLKQSIENVRIKARWVQSVKQENSPSGTSQTTSLQRMTGKILENATKQTHSMLKSFKTTAGLNIKHEHITNLMLLVLKKGKLVGCCPTKPTN